MKGFISILCGAILLCFSVNLAAQALTCNNQVNLSVDAACSISSLSVDAFLEGDINPSLYSWDIVTNTGVPLTYTDPNDPYYLGNYVGQCLTFNVYLNSTGNTCWGTVCIEDKIDPSVDCECETPYLADGVTPNPECSFRCYEVWDLELLEDQDRVGNELLPGFPMATDNCGNIDPVTVTYSYSSNASCGSSIVTRNLFYTYNSPTGGQSNVSCQQQFLFEGLSTSSVGNTNNGAWDGYTNIFAANAGSRPNFDLYLPEKTVNIGCGADSSPSSIAAAYDVDTPGRPVGIDRDDYSDTPNILEHNEGIPYAAPYVVIAGWSGNYHAKAITETGICNIYLAYDDQFFDACSPSCLTANNKIVRTWTILDWCGGNTINYIQNIKRTDNEAPTLSAVDLTVSVDPWACAVDYYIPPPTHLHDNCDTNPQYNVIPPPGISYNLGLANGIPKGVHTFMYEATDCCGNASLTPFTITVIDATPPNAISYESLVIQLVNSQGPDGVAKLFAKDVDNFSHDGCGPVHLEIRRPIEDWCNPGSNNTFNNDGHLDDNEDDTDGGAFVKFCCEDAITLDADGTLYGLHDVILRVWDDGDGNGIYGTAGDNYNESWTTVRVEDKNAPVVVCPPLVILNCEEDFNNYDITGRPYASTACSDLDCYDAPTDQFTRKPMNQAPLLGQEIPAYNPSCRTGAIRRTWPCGGSACNQWIIMEPSNAQALDIEWPEDKELNCIDEDFGEPIFTTNQCELIGTTLESDTFFFEEGTCYKILNRWTVINWCDHNPTTGQGQYEYTQIIKFFDTEKPELTVQDTCFAANTQCVGENLSITADASDNGVCASPWLKWEVEVDVWSDWEVDYTYSSFLLRTDEYYIEPTSGGLTINFEDGIPNGCSSRHRVLWNVHDGCGNVTSHTSFFTIEDKKKPTPYVLELSTALMQNGQVELWANDFDAGSFDNCSESDYLKFTFSDQVPPQLLNPNEDDPWYDVDGVASENEYLNGNAEKWDGNTNSSAMIFNEDDIAASNGGLFDLRVYVWDLCGNVDFVDTKVRLIQNNGANRAHISGRVATEAGEGVEGVTMSASSDQDGYPFDIYTDDSGDYLFEYNLMDYDYEISGQKNDDWMNGVTTLDIVLIQQHILDLEPLNSPYKLIAADVSNDERISGIDLVQIRKLILGLTVDFPNNGSWRLVNANDQMNGDQPWPFNEFAELQNLEEDMMHEDFVAVKIGDVNETASFRNDGNIESRSARQLKINVDEKQEGDVRTLTFTSSNFNEVVGFQFALTGGFEEIVSIDEGAISISGANVSLINGYLNVSWNVDQPLNLNNEELFSISLSANEDELYINESFMKAEAYQGESFEVLDVVLSEEGTVFQLGQNIPNPFNSETQISFILSKDETVEFTIHDVNGFLITKRIIEGQIGENIISLDRHDLSVTSRVLYYTIRTQEDSQTKKMILLN